MRVNAASDQQQTVLTHALRDHEEHRVIQIESEDSFETILMTLQLQSDPVVLLLPEQSHAFNDPLHFAQLSQVREPNTISFTIPRSRVAELARYAHQYGFSFASSLEKAAQLLPPQTFPDEVTEQTSHGELERLQTLVEDEQENVGTMAHSTREEPIPEWTPQSVTTQSQGPAKVPPPLIRKRAAKKRIGLIASMVALLVIGGAGLLPALFTEQPILMGATQLAASPVVKTVGQISFSSSGQLDPSSSKGVNDTITVNLHNLSTPASGKRYYAWLMPDKTDDNTVPLLLGSLAITSGKAQLTYTPPDHGDLLTSYSGFEVAEQDATTIPPTPPLDAKNWRYVGAIPDVPTPGDEEHFSLLDHMRHLLAKDPTLQQLGLQGGLDIWLDRNAEKVLEWSSAARDSWQGGGQTDLIHQLILRTLEYLDGAVYVFNTGDVPAGSPLLVDPQAGHIGLLEISPTQVLPAYLTHVDIHLQGMINAPGHTEAQQQLAIKIDTALKTDTLLLQKVRQDAIKLGKMNKEQLIGNDALSFLNDMVSNATTAYTGQFDQTTGGDINGISWIHNELQGLTSMSVTTPVDTNK